MNHDNLRGTVISLSLFLTSVIMFWFWIDMVPWQISWGISPTVFDVIQMNYVHFAGCLYFILVGGISSMYFFESIGLLTFYE